MHIILTHELRNGLRKYLILTGVQVDSTSTSCPDGAICDAALSILIQPSISPTGYYPPAMALFSAAYSAITTSSFQVHCHWLYLCLLTSHSQSLAPSATQHFHANLAR